MQRIVISGIGIVCPRAIGLQAFERALCSDPNARPACRVPDFLLEEVLENARSFRRVADATKFALAAMALAVADAGFSPEDFGGERTALIVGITHGAVSYAVQFHRTLVAEGPPAASPLCFSESVPNAPAGNGSIAFGIRGPVHTLIGDEPVGAQAIDLAASLLREELADRCLVVGTEEWNEVVAHAYAQIDRAMRRRRDQDATPPLGEGAAALVLEQERAVVRRGAAPHAMISGWSLGRWNGEKTEAAIVLAVREAFRTTGQDATEADHVVTPTGRHRRAARRAIDLVRAGAGRPPEWIDLLPVTGNPAGAANLLQVAASAALISAGKMRGPGVALAAGIQRTLSAVVLSRPVL